jgi:predicted transcriptional regulator
MANSPLVSIRIPPETLARLDQLAQELYPARRAGRNPNRSQVILDAIDQFLKQHEAETAIDSREPESITPVPHPELLADEIISPEAFDLQQSNLMKPSMREYIDWWSNYLSYLKKVTNLWFGPYKDN